MHLLKRLGLVFGFKKPIAFHTYWSKPQNGPIQFKDYEILSAVAGPILWRRFCGEEFWLFTDEIGYRDFSKRGIIGLYDRIVFINESELKDINPKVFWAAGKIQAYRQAPIPFVSMDFDAYVKRPFWRSLFRLPVEVMPLNTEPDDWECYRDNENHFLEWFDKDHYDWTLPPYNVGVLGIFDKEFRDAYANESIAFMRSMSLFSGAQFKPYVDYAVSGNGYKYFEEQVFAEQRLLAMVAKKLDKKLHPIGRFNRTTDHLVPNKKAVHLWSSKHGFNWHHDAKELWAQNLLRKLYSISCDRCWFTITQAGLPWVPVLEENSGLLHFTRSTDLSFSGYKPSMPLFAKEKQCSRNYCNSRGQIGD